MKSKKQNLKHAGLKPTLFLLVIILASTAFSLYAAGQEPAKQNTEIPPARTPRPARFEVKGYDIDHSNEAIRVIKLLPAWKPGKLAGNPVKVWYTMPVTFSLK